MRAFNGDKKMIIRSVKIKKKEMHVLTKPTISLVVKTKAKNTEDN